MYYLVVRALHSDSLEETPIRWLSFRPEEEVEGSDWWDSLPLNEIEQNRIKT